MQDFGKEMEVKMAIKTMQSEPHPFVHVRSVDTCKTGSGFDYTIAITNKPNSMCIGNIVVPIHTLPLRCKMVECMNIRHPTNLIIG